jgi:hypothetical protein
MKVIDKMRNMMVQEFQHFVEFQLIQAMNLKMHMIQFDSIVSLIQIKLLKVNHKMRNVMLQEFQHFVDDDPRISISAEIERFEDNEKCRIN